MLTCVRVVNLINNTASNFRNAFKLTFVYFFHKFVICQKYKQLPSVLAKSLTMRTQYPSSQWLCQHLVSVVNDDAVKKFVHSNQSQCFVSVLKKGPLYCPCEQCLTLVSPAVLLGAAWTGTLYCPYEQYLTLVSPTVLLGVVDRLAILSLWTVFNPS